MANWKYNNGEGDYCGKRKDNSFSNLPKVTELGDGLYAGVMSGYSHSRCFRRSSHNSESLSTICRIGRSHLFIL